MSKLIRIDSNRNDGRFLPNFTTDIKLKENSSIALKDICFEPEFQIVNVNATNNRISTKPVSLDGASIYLNQSVEPAMYDFKDQYRLAQELTNALNKTIALNQTFPTYSAFSSYRVRSEGENGDPDSRFEIVYRISPATPIESLDSTGDRFFNQEDGADNIEFEEIGDRVITKQTTTSVSDERYRMVANKGVGLNKGGAVFYAQVFDSVASGGFQEFNGFKIGLTLEKKGDFPSDTNTTNPRIDPDTGVTETIPDTARNFEIDFREGGFPYRFRSGGLKSSPAQQTSALNPFRFSSTTPSTNDILMISVTTFDDKKVIEGAVLQYTGNGNTEGEENVLFRYTLTNEDIGNEFGAEFDPNDLDTIYFTPYIVFRGDETRCRATNVGFTPDTTADISTITSFLPFKNPPYFNLEHEHTIANRQIVDNQFQNVIPQVATGYNDDLQDLIDVGMTSTINISNELGEVLGYGSRNNDDTDREFTFSGQRFLRQDEDPSIPAINPRIFGLVGAKFTFQNLPISAGDDYFLVELNNLNLDSYSSIPNENLVRNPVVNRTNQGERKNIVATIPVENQAFGRRITYEPNELHFINIKNSETANLRNLQVRILHPNYTEVETYGRSHICLYVTD